MYTKKFIIKKDYKWFYLGVNQWATVFDEKYIPIIYFDKWEAECIMNNLCIKNPESRYYLHELTEDESKEITFFKLLRPH